MIAIPYARFSPRPNAQACESCEHQLADIKDWCKKKAWKLGTEYSDPECSGDDASREELWLAIKAASRKGHALVVRSLDRLARDAILQELLIQRVQSKGGVVVSLAGEGAVEGEDPDGNNQMIRTILAAIHEQKRKITARMTHAGMLRRQREGRLMTRPDNPPYGQRYDPATQRVVPDEREQGILKEILAWHADGKGKEEIAALLNTAGIRPRKGFKWHRSAVRKIINREVHGLSNWRPRPRQIPVLPD